MTARLGSVSERTPIRVLVTRSRGQAASLAELLAAAGAVPIAIPTIEIVPPVSFAALDAALAQLRSFDWLIFTSANAVQVFAERGRGLGQSAQPRRIAAIGPATAKAVETLLARPVNLMPRHYVQEALAEALMPEAPGCSMLLVRAAVARDALPETLEACGARVTVAEAYRTIVPEESVAALRQLFETAPPDAITFTSASTAHHLVALLERAGVPLPEGIVLASIGPITSDAMRNLGLEPAVEAPEATLGSLVDTLIAWLTAVS